MSTGNQPEQKVTPDILFIIAVAVIGCLVSVFGAAAGNWWIIGSGVLFMWIAFKCREIYKRKHGKS
jgi:hypothetical protein